MVEFDFVCPKKWDDLDKNAGCTAHCSFCSRDVVDVTGMSDTEVKELIDANKGDVCVSIQTERVSMSSGRIWFKRTLAAIVLLCVPLFGHSQQVDPNRTVILPNGNQACEKEGLAEKREPAKPVTITEEKQPKKKRRRRRRRRMVMGRTIGTPSF